MTDFSAEVIIAGAGPVGAVAAFALASKGIDVLLIEAQTHCAEDLRASTLHPPTLEMLDQLGLFHELDAQGLRAPVYQYRNRQTDERLSFDMSELSDVTRFPFRLQCEQYKLARLIAQKLQAFPNADLRFSNRIVGIEQDGKGVKVVVETPFNLETLKCQFLIGCDGANSFVRKHLNTKFEGFTYPEKFLTFSTHHALEDHFDGLEHVNYVADPTEWMVLLRVPSLWRVLVPARNNDDRFLCSNEKKWEVFHHLLGDPTIRTEHRTIYRVHQRVASSYVEGRVILAGDAAHLNNPLGGFGMNSGIHDVWNLSQQLHGILRTGRPLISSLETYAIQRKTVMHEFVQAQTIRNKEALETEDADGLSARQTQLASILANDHQRREFLLNQSMFNSLKRERELA